MNLKAIAFDNKIKVIAKTLLSKQNMNVNNLQIIKSHQTHLAPESKNIADNDCPTLHNALETLVTPAFLDENTVSLAVVLPAAAWQLLTFSAASLPQLI